MSGKTTAVSKALLRKLALLDRQSLFRQTYQKGLWGAASDYPFYSGSGSHDPEQFSSFLIAVQGFVQSLAQPPIIVDVGCGDFHIGSQLALHARHYHGCDIVPELIDYNRSKYTAANISFHQLDAVTDELPDGNLLLVRQVLQHLDNNEITAILRHFKKFSHIIVTEHLPSGDFIANKNKPHGPDNRMRIQSGVDLLQPPFSLRGFKASVLDATSSRDFPGIIKTLCFSRD